MEPTPENYITIQVATAVTKQPIIKQLKVPEGITVKEVLGFTEIKRIFLEIKEVATKIGIYGKITTPETILQQNDRIEIYKPLAINPKEKRKIKAKLKQTH
ncbi:protein RnfH [Nitrosomonas stercoris]|uniref:UPF0125 protein Nstercoris_01343 n=1 Tax=Nitrosomonas stercoris TaxID=1444684 RepID=A0A4Y1YMR0_9PROT|nr:protein RnfH [Nitrosomonas stercoris]